MLNYTFSNFSLVFSSLSNFYFLLTAFSSSVSETLLYNNLNFLKSLDFVSIIFSRCILHNNIVLSYSSSVFSFWGISVLFSIMPGPIYIPTNSVPTFCFLHTDGIMWSDAWIEASVPLSLCIVFLSLPSIFLWSLPLL